MTDLHPSLWRTCRVLANENRLHLLWKLFQEGESSVSRLGEAVGLTEPVASSYLRALNARGLILPRRQKNFVLYRPLANPEVAGADRLLEALRGAYDAFMPVPAVIRSVTAFTHERRIEIVRALSGGELAELQLSMKTGISPQALYRHLRKLEARNFVERGGEKLHLSEPDEGLSKELLALAVSL
ncbi:ArsR family transcriptional regulator [Pontiella agarivorans]|uniref:ArsR family transcriptional regulator n=1 Tax=Pontiella agarivorans TaxID=3038953 RepID=A0ABU5N085_9BACT|nr:ArsR family transcriptional regulator [Pontiella agarivorans]MDZ8119850.1 ArsR family transcriptional regulator [Pontiella agarivorans]